MINEKKLKKELQKRFDAFVRKCGMADDMKSDGYASCYDDVSDIIEQLAAKNDIEQLSHYIYSHLCKYRPLKGLLKRIINSSFSVSCREPQSVICSATV